MRHIDASTRTAAPLPITWEPPTPPRRWSEITILVADDDEDSRDLYVTYLARFAGRVLSEPNGFKALHAVKHECPDAVVLDIAMPGLTGLDVIRRLRADRALRRLPIVVVSGQLARESALSLGADSYLSKPCLPPRLTDELRRLLEIDDPEEGEGA